MTAPILRSRAALRQAALSTRLLTLCGRRFRAERGRLARARNQASSLRPARRARWARAGNQASSLPPAQAPRQRLAARTPTRRKTRASSPRIPIRSPRFRTWWRRLLMRWWRRLLMWWRRLLMWWRRFLMWWHRLPIVVAPVTDVVAPVTDCLAPVSDVIAPGQDMVAGAVVPLTQLPSDLSSFMLGIAGVAPVGDGSGGIDGAGPSRSPIAAGRATCRYLGRAGGRQRNQGCNARCDYAQSSVSAVRDGTASVQWCQSDGCGVVFPACFRRTPANRFLVGAGRCRSARRRRACDPCPLSGCASDTAG